MKNDLNSLIAHYQEKFDDEFGLFFSQDHLYPEELNRGKDFLAQIILEVITQAFLATKVEKFTHLPLRGYDSFTLEDKGFNTALTEVEALRKTFMSEK